MTPEQSKEFRAKFQALVKEFVPNTEDFILLMTTDDNKSHVISNIPREEIKGCLLSAADFIEHATPVNSYPIPRSQ